MTQIQVQYLSTVQVKSWVDVKFCDPAHSVTCCTSKNDEVLLAKLTLAVDLV